MKWFNSEINNLKNTLIPYTLHGINEEIYDEIVEKEDGFYYLIIRCGTMPFTNAHNFSTFKTDGNTIVYPLPSSEIKEIKLNWRPPNVFGDNSTILVNSGPVIPEFTGNIEVDRRYKEYRKCITDNTIIFKDINNIDLNREVYVSEIFGTEEGLGELVVDEFGMPILDDDGNEQYNIEIYSIDSDTNDDSSKEIVSTIISPKKLFINDKLSWNAGRERYEVEQVIEDYKPIQDGLIVWLEGRDGEENNFVWRDRTSNGNDLDLTNLENYVEWDGYGYIIKDGFKGLSSSEITTNCPEGYTLTVNFECNTYVHDNINLFNGTYSIKNEDGELIGYKNNAKDNFGAQLYNKVYNCSYVISNDSTKLFINNNLIDKNIDEEFVYSPDITFSLGDKNDTNKAQIKIHSIKMYNRALSEEELTHNYNYEKGTQTGNTGVPESEFTNRGLVAWYEASDGIVDKQLKNKVDDYYYHMTLFGQDMAVVDGQITTNGTNNYGKVNELSGSEVRYVEMAYTRLQTKDWESLLSASTTANGWQVEMSANKNVSLCAKNSGTQHLGGFTQEINEEAWIAINVLDNKVFEVYLNGEKVKEGQLAQLTQPTQEFMFFATGSSVQLYSKIKFRQAKIYNEPLSGDEIKKNYNFYLKTKDRNKGIKLASKSVNVNERGKILIQEGITVFTSKKSSITLDVPYKGIRGLVKPKDVIATISPDSDLVTLDWTAVTGATSYKILLDGEEYSQVSSNHWETREEIKGLLSVKAVNDLTESKVSESVYVMSVPNETFISYFKNEYNNGYSFEVHFPDKSDIETSYKVYYKVDDRQEQCDILPASSAIGTVIKHKFTVPIVLDRIRIRVVAVNDTGENETVPPTTLYITPTPKWTYKDDSKTVLLSWENRFENVTRYNLKIKVNNVVQDEVNVETDGVEVGAKVSYNYPLAENDELKVSIAAVMDDIYHIYSEEITASKALDNTLMPPSDFKFRKITDTQIEFSWYDEHTCEEGFELTYSVSNKEPETVFIPTLSMTGTGRKHSYIFNFEEHGFVTAKVRMKWELGVSRYTDEVLVYYLPITGEPPSYLRREVLDGNVRLEWEGQQYVDKYQVYKTIGTEDADTSVEIIDCTENNCNVYINYNYNKNQYNAYEADNRWKVCKYSKEKYLKNKDRGKHWIEGLEPLIVDYKPSDATGLHFNWGTDFIAHAETYVYLENPAQISFNVFTDDEGCVFVNDKKVLETVSGRWDSLTANLNKGWNRIEILVHQSAGGHAINLSRAIYSFVEISGIASNFIPKPMRVEFSVVTKFLDGTVSEKSKPMIFYPQYQELDLNVEVKNPVNIVKNINTGVYTKVSNEFDIESKSLNGDKREYLVHQKTIGKHLISPNDVSMTITGKDIETPYNVDTILINANSRQSEHRVSTVSTKNTLLENLIYSTLYTRVQKDYLVYTETNRVRIVTIGDSITAGHPGHWAETMTGDERSQYQYWLNIRLKGQFEIINKGYGSDTTDDMLARFDKDALGYNASYCIIQGGTNDLYWAMAEANGDKSYLDAKVEQMKNNIIQMVRKCWDNGITPIIGTLIPRTGATGIYKDALYEYNQWIIDYCLGNDNIFYIDFFNAGKEKIPPTPLEDPANPGALNPIYDGDAIYDEFGNLIKQGRGIHPNWEGYRIMGECIPLNIFKTGETGLKLYLDADCTIEEEYNDDDKVNPFYRIDIGGVRRKVTKKIVRYVKNVGNNQNLFVAYSYDNYNIDVKFLDANGRRMDYANGLLPASAVARIEMVFDVYDKDSKASVNLYLASREFKVG